jgi:hypothetical protein
MNDLIPQRVFMKRNECIGSLRCGQNSVENLHLVVQYPLVRQGAIAGHIIGKADTYIQLAKLFNLGTERLQFLSRTDIPFLYEIGSDKLHLRSVQRRDIISDPGHEASYVVAELDFENLSIREEREQSKASPRQIVFYLAGPRMLWRVMEHSSFVLEGDTPRIIHNPVQLNHEFPFSLKIFLEEFRDKEPMGGTYSVTTDVLCLHFESNVPPEHLSDQDLLTECCKLADDLALLVSFASRSWVTWFRYQVFDSRGHKEYIRVTREASVREIGYHSTLVEEGKAWEFFRSSLTELRKLRTDGFDLSLPIMYFISAMEATYTEEKFATLFLCLEKLKDMFVHAADRLKSILPPSDFDTLVDRLKPIIKDLVPDNQTRCLIYPKLKELNRPSLKSVLHKMFDKYGIEWSDVYPKGSNFTLIKTRDGLFHSSSEPDTEFFVKEYERLRVLVERMILAILSWHDYSRSPDVGMKRWLSE